MGALVLNLIAAVLSPHLSNAVDPVPPATAIAANVATAATAVIYDLRNLKAEGFSFEQASDSRRYFYKFSNENGIHFLVYNDFTGVARLADSSELDRIAAAPSLACSVRLECPLRAICLDDCKSFFYEFTNLPTAPAMKDRNTCVLRSYNCAGKPSASAALAPAPAPAPPALPEKR